MASTTGIELGPDTCVLAGVRIARAGVADVVALHTIEPASWPAHDTALAAMLRGIRRSKGFPKRARVVAWGLPEDATNDAITRAAMRPLVDAGFRVDTIVTPPQALAILAATRSKPGPANAAVVWLALNTHGAAIAIVRGTELLFARTFQWTYNPHLLEAKAQLLQRYSLISHLAPEVRRGIAAVRAAYGVSVDAAVTCGDLPELRSLTMPLIEELDLEVETLDSMDGLRPVGKAKRERLAEAAPAIRLACAAALARVRRPRRALSPAARIAAAIALLAGIAFGGYWYWKRATAPSTAPRAAESRVSKPVAKPPVKTAAAKPAPPVTSAPAVTKSRVQTPSPAPVTPKPSPQTVAKAEPVTPKPSPQTVAKAEPVAAKPATPIAAAKNESAPAKPPAETTSTAGSVAAKLPVQSSPKPSPQAAAKVEPVSPKPPVQTAAAKPPIAPPVAPKGTAPPQGLPKTSLMPPKPSVQTAAKPERVAPKTPAQTAAKAEPVAPKPSVQPSAKAEPVAPKPSVQPSAKADFGIVAEQQSRSATDTRGVVFPPSNRPASQPRQVPLKDPLPKVDSILIDQERRLAIIEGTVAAVGDSIGPRVIVQIERDAVVLREPSGLLVRVPLRSRQVSRAEKWLAPSRNALFFIDLHFSPMRRC